MKSLFVAGSPRSGTTGLADYLNQHEQILLCRERYKYGPRKVTPELFTFERILDYGERETNIPRQHHEELLESKDPAKLKWIGDKYPTYVKQLKILAKNNPGAHFIVPYRPVEEVAESFQARADDPEDQWPAENGFELGVQLWNSALRHTRDYVESTRNTRLLVVSYHQFFGGDKACMSMLSRFLGLELGDSMHESWAKSSRRFTEARRSKTPLSEEQYSLIRHNKDHETEKWILDFLEEQHSRALGVSQPGNRGLGNRTKQPPEKSQVADMRGRLRRLRRDNQRLNTRVNELERELESIRTSRTWRLAGRLKAIQARAERGFVTRLMRLREAMRTSDNSAVSLEGYDFLDFGASKGASINFGVRRLGGTRGLGIDLDPEKVRQMKDKGFDCIEADVTRLQLPPASVRFVIMSHFLEHLPGPTEVERAVESAARTASDFLFIQGPYFDADDYLKSQGLKLYWSDWTGHPCHLTTDQLHEILLKLGLEDHVMMVCDEIADSSDAAVHPLDSPPDQHDYDPGLHPEKPYIKFAQPLYRSIVCCVRLRHFDGWEQVLHAPKKGKGLENHIRGNALSSPQSPHNSDTPQGREPQPLAVMKRKLLLKRRWAYLRYLHMRQALLLAKDVESVLVVGSGHGFAEVALALEFPYIRFHLTDVESETTPNYHRAEGLVEQWDLGNVTFGVSDILTPQPERYDLVASVEVLEHIENDTLASAEMRAAAAKYVFALVPFADDVTNRDEKMRARVWESHEHYRVGYDEKDLRKLFPNVVALRGCYWKENGGAHRKRLYDMSNEEIKARMLELQEEAQHDLIDATPVTYPEAQGIWVLARV